MMRRRRSGVPESMPAKLPDPGGMRSPAGSSSTMVPWPADSWDSAYWRPCFIENCSVRAEMSVQVSWDGGVVTPAPIAASVMVTGHARFGWDGAGAETMTPAIAPARSRLPLELTDDEDDELVSCHAGVSVMSAVWSTPLEALTVVRAVHPAGPVIVSLLLSEPVSENRTACAEGAAALSASDDTELAKLVTSAATCIHGRIPDTSTIRAASAAYGPVGATWTMVVPPGVTRAAGAAQTPTRTFPAAPESVPGAPSGSHQLWASSATQKLTPDPATAGRQATRANSQSPAVLVTLACTGRADG